MIEICGVCGQPDNCAPWCTNRYSRPQSLAGTSLPRIELLNLIGAELDRAYAKHGREPWSRHEFYAILLEEVDELWADIKSDAPMEQLTKELVQVAAMCFRYYETRDSRWTVKG